MTSSMVDVDERHPEKRGAPAKFGSANVVRGMRASVTGDVISLNLELSESRGIFGRAGFTRTVRLHNELRPLADGRQIVVNDDEVSFALQGSSQWDAFAHFGLIADDGRGVFHGNVGLDETADGTGAPTLGIHALGPAIATRGVLLDALAEFGPDREYLEPGDIVDRACLERCIARQALSIEPGDAVLIYTGFERKLAALGGAIPPASSGVDASTVGLWEELDIIALIGDNPAVESMPSDYTTHIGVLRNLGIPMGELWALDELAQACRTDSRYDFFLVSVPLSIRGAFGSTANAIAIR
jgi:kynurenine formamidase